MNSTDKQTAQNDETLEHLLGVVVENREKRCSEVRDKANEQAGDIIKQAYARARARLHRHVNVLRDKYRVRIVSAIARNQTKLRQQNQERDRVLLDQAWPMLRESMLGRWNDPQSRGEWLKAALENASSILLAQRWHIEHPPELDERDIDRIMEYLASAGMRKPKFVSRDDIAAGIRISARGTSIDATLQGLLRQRGLVEAKIIARVRQGEAGNE